MLVVRGTKKLRDRVKGPVADDADESTTVLGDWFATALFWRPQVALLVNTATLLPVFCELAPAARLLDRVPAAIATVLRRHGVPEAFIEAELAAMDEVRIAPTNDRRVLGVVNEFAFLGEHHQSIEPVDLVQLSVRLAGTPLGPLRKRHRFPDRELAAIAGPLEPLAEVIPIRPGVAALGVADPEAEVSAEAVTGPPKGDVYQLKVSLLDTKPPVWRRVLVDGAATLDAVHEAIQAAFGWWNYHLHEFEIGPKRYGVPDPDDDWGLPTIDETGVRLDSVARTGSRFTYVYDFGDNWRHKLEVEKVTVGDPAVMVPACVDGRRACPPEDCGGTGGFAELLTALADPGHRRHRELKEWIGRPYDPAAFDPTEFEDNLRSGRLALFDD